MVVSQETGLYLSLDRNSDGKRQLDNFLDIETLRRTAQSDVVTRKGNRDILKVPMEKQLGTSNKIK